MDLLFLLNTILHVSKLPHFSPFIPIFPHPHSPILLCLWGWTPPTYSGMLGEELQLVAIKVFLTPGKVAQ